MEREIAQGLLCTIASNGGGAGESPTVTMRLRAQLPAARQNDHRDKHITSRSCAPARLVIKDIFIEGS